jgi:hypothetical protein
LDHAFHETNAPTHRTTYRRKLTEMPELVIVAVVSKITEFIQAPGRTSGTRQ